MPRGGRLRWVPIVGLGLLVAGAEFVTAILVFGVLDFATTTGETESSVPNLGIELDLGWLLVLAGAAFLLRGLLGLASTYAQEAMIQRSAGQVSSLLHRQYLYAPYQFHLMRNSSELIRTAMLSVDKAATNVVRPMATVVTQVPIITTLAVLLLTISPVLTIGAAVVVAASLALILGVVQRRLRSPGRRSEAVTTALLKNLKDSFESVREIKAYGAEPFFDTRFRRQRSIETSLRITRFTLAAVPSRVLEFIVLAGLLVLIDLVRGGESFSDLIPVLGVFAYSTLRIVPSINRVVSASNSLKFGQESIANVANDLEASAVVIPTAPPVQQVPAGALFEDSIELKGVSFSYPGGRGEALRSVDLKILRGEMLAIAGTSGAGKSTLVDVLLRLLEPDSGSILIDGAENIPSRWRSAVGVVSQQVILIDGTLRENVAFGAREVADDKRVMWALERAQLGDWIGSLPEGLDTMVGESGKLVSGGPASTGCHRPKPLPPSPASHPRRGNLRRRCRDRVCATRHSALAFCSDDNRHCFSSIGADSGFEPRSDAGCRSDRGCRPISRAGGSRSRVPPTRRSVTPIPGDVACERSRPFSAPGRTLLCCVAPSTLPTTVS